MAFRASWQKLPKRYRTALHLAMQEVMCHNLREPLSYNNLNQKLHFLDPYKDKNFLSQKGNNVAFSPSCISLPGKLLHQPSKARNFAAISSSDILDLE
jgi:hypothetical protein